MTEQIKVTTAKPLSGKKVFYFIQSIHARLVAMQSYQLIALMVL